MRQLSVMTRQKGFLSLPNDNIVKIIGVALSLCLVCSVIVAVTATVLKPKQVENKLLDKKTNILLVAGLDDASVPVDQRFAQIESKVIDLATGEPTDQLDPATFDQRKASKDPALNTVLSKQQDIAVIKTRSNFANVYLLKEAGELKKVILPIKGYGLWSTMYGFIALEGDASTVSGITFYEHGETPGLGGEIENLKWQQSWQGKQVFDTQGDVSLQVIKGMVTAATSDAQYKIDGLAGATLTSNGVSNLVKFWMGDDGFGPYLERLRTQMAASSNESTGTVSQRNIARGDLSNG